VNPRIQTRRWNDPQGKDEGHRILICRYRPRGLPKSEETWDEWQPNLGPSRELHADFYGKHGSPIGWPAYRARYLQEMKEQRDAIGAIARRVANGDHITLLCSSACEREARCHRSLLRELIEKQVSSSK
jgi:uncharacterized protein YeaO (DUF488 family)